VENKEAPKEHTLGAWDEIVGAGGSPRFENNSFFHSVKGPAKKSGAAYFPNKASTALKCRAAGLLGLKSACLLQFYEGGLMEAKKYSKSTF
jgi:hypothetical protein